MGAVRDGSMTRLFDPLNPDISMYIPHTVLHIFSIF